MQKVASDTKALLARAGVAFERVDTLYELDMLYVGQTHTVSVPVTMAGTSLTRDAIHAAFDAAYREAFGRLLENIPMRVMNYRVAVIGRRPDLDMAVFAPVDGKPAEACRTGTRRIYADGAFHEAAIYDRLSLEEGAVVAGPAILEQSDTTIFVDPGLVGRVDRFGNLLIERSGG